MRTYEYEVIIVDYEDSQAMLAEYGANGWRLHTCEPIQTLGSQGSGDVRVFCVLDRAFEDEDEPEHAEELQPEDKPDTGVHGIEMKPGPGTYVNK